MKLQNCFTIPGGEVKPMNMYYVNWVEGRQLESYQQSPNRINACVCGLSNGYLTLEKAVEAAKEIAKRDNIALVWIDEFNDQFERFDIPYLETYTDAFGFRFPPKE